MPIGDHYPDIYPDVYGDVAPGEVTLASILGPGLVLDYDARYYTPGTPPDVAAAANQVAAWPQDLSQATESQRPHEVTDASGFPAWEFDSAESRQLDNADAVSFGAIGDSVQCWLVGRQGALQAGGLVSLGSFRMRYQSTANRLTTDSGAVTAAHGGYQTADTRRIVHARADATGIRSYQGATLFDATAGDARLTAGPDVVVLGNTFGSHYTGTMERVILALNATDAQCDEVTGLLQSGYGL